LHIPAGCVAWDHLRLRVRRAAERLSNLGLPIVDFRIAQIERAPTERRPRRSRLVHSVRLTIDL
jgi:hypothetical protein